MWPKFRFKRSRGEALHARSSVAIAKQMACFPPIDLGAGAAQKIAVIGDIHGMDAAFEDLLAQLAEQEPEARLICVGDLIDRGEGSAAVLRRAFDLRHRVEVLLGNHEEMLLRFLDAPETNGARWLRYGGLQCFASFDIGGVSDTSAPECMWVARDALREAIGPELEAWLRSLPRSWQSGNVVVVHGGADPWLPISRQTNQSLTWGHPDFGHRARTDGFWVVHGHTIVETPSCANGIISVDTGAYAGGGLTAAVISADSVHFVTVKS